MTSEEMERAIKILLNNQARYELRLERTGQQIKQTNEQVRQTNEQLQETNKQVGEASRQIGETNRQVGELSGQVDEISGQVGALVGTVGTLAQSQRELTEVVLKSIQAQDKVNKTLSGSISDLAKAIERFISQGRNGES